MDITYFRVNETEANITGKYHFIQQHLTAGIPYLVIISLDILLGTIGNLFIIGAVLYYKKLKSVGNVFIVNLAIADLFITTLVNPFSIVGLLEGEQWFSKRPVLCEAVASICLTSCFCSLLSIGAISFNRYIHICHNERYPEIYTLFNSLWMCVALWLVSFLLELPNFVGWGDHVYDKKTLTCVWDRTANFSYSIFFAIVGVVFPISLISICYLKIYLYVREQKLKVCAVTGNEKTTFNSRSRRESMKLARTLFLIFIFFTACWAPYATIVVVDRYDVYRQEIHFFALLLAHTHSSINSFLYYASNQNFRDGYKHLLRMLPCRRLVSSGKAFRVKLNDFASTNDDSRTM